MQITRLAALGCLGLMTACAEPLGHTDGIWPTAGSAQAQNLNAQTMMPATIGWSANPGGSGPRAANVMVAYKTRTLNTGAASLSTTPVP